MSDVMQPYNILPSFREAAVTATQHIKAMLGAFSSRITDRGERITQPMNLRPSNTDAYQFDGIEVLPTKNGLATYVLVETCGDRDSATPHWQPVIRRSRIGSFSPYLATELKLLSYAALAGAANGNSFTDASKPGMPVTDDMPAPLRSQLRRENLRRWMAGTSLMYGQLGQ